MAISSTTYPVFEFERKHKKSKRKRRIAVVRGGDSSLWYPLTTDYSSRVKLDGGIVEGLRCLNYKIGELSKSAPRPIYTTITNNYIGRAIYDGGDDVIFEGLTCLDNEIKELQA